MNNAQLARLDGFHNDQYPEILAEVTERDPSGPRGIVVYTRPGCPYCFTLRAGLRRAGLAYREINIWDDPDAAAFVRSVANGNETVPTVVVDDVHMVNPSARRVSAVAAHTSGPPTSKHRHWLRRSARTGETA